MASKDNKAEVERKPKRKGQKRKARRKNRQDNKARRVGALDRMAESRGKGTKGGKGAGGSGRAEYDARLKQAQTKMDTLGVQGQMGDKLQPGFTGGPAVAPDPSLQPGFTGGPAVAPQPVNAGTALGRPLPQPAVEPQPVIQPQIQPAPQPPQDIDPLTGAQVNYGTGGEQSIDPETGQPIGSGVVGVDPAQGGMAEPAMVPQPPQSIDPVTGVAGAGINTGAPVSDMEAQTQAAMGQAQAAGNSFNLNAPQVAPPEQYFNNRLGAPGMQNPRDLERIRRKRLALINPQVQQLRPQGRGLPQIRYQGGPAFQGAFQQPPGAGVRGGAAPGINAPGVSAQAQGQLRQPQNQLRRA